MIKLKNILTEAYAWERQAGKALPTLAEVQTAYDAKMREDVDHEEEVDDDGYPVMDGGRPSGSSREVDNDYMDEAAKPDFLDLDGDGDETEPMKSAAADSTAHGNFVNKARAKAHVTKKDCSVYGIDGTGKATKLNSTSDVENVKYKKFTVKSKDNLAESFKKRMLGNFKGSEYILSETFKRK